MRFALKIYCLDKKKEDLNKLSDIKKNIFFFFEYRRLELADN